MLLLSPPVDCRFYFPRLSGLLKPRCWCCLCWWLAAPGAHHHQLIVNLNIFISLLCLLSLLLPLFADMVVLVLGTVLRQCWSLHHCGLLTLLPLPPVACGCIFSWCQVCSSLGTNAASAPRSLPLDCQLGNFWFCCHWLCTAASNSVATSVAAGWLLLVTCLYLQSQTLPMLAA